MFPVDWDKTHHGKPQALLSSDLPLVVTDGETVWFYAVIESVAREREVKSSYIWLFLLVLWFCSSNY